MPRASSAAWSSRSIEARQASVDVSMASGSPLSTDLGWDGRPDRTSSKGLFARCKVCILYVEYVVVTFSHHLGHCLCY